MLIYQQLEEISKERKDFIGWNKVAHKDSQDREELLISPCYESDYRPIDENDTRNRKEGIQFYTLEEVMKELDGYENFSIDYMGRIKVLLWANSINK